MNFIKINFFYTFLFFNYSTFCTPYNTLIETIYGSENVKEETEKYIRDVATQMGITRYFHIKKLNDRAKAAFGTENAFALLNYVFVHEPFFKLLSKEE